MSAPKVYISILNWNGKDMTRELLNSIEENTVYDNYEIFISDNGSTDGSVNMLKSEFDHHNLVMYDDNIGFSRANNVIFERAISNDVGYVLLLNNDMKLDQQGWLCSLITTAEKSSRYGIVGPKIIKESRQIDSDGEHVPLGYIGFKDDFEYNRVQLERPAPGDLEYVDIVKGAAFLIDTSVIKDIGGLDEHFSPAYGEETDYCIRAWDAGFKVVYTPNIVLKHFESQSSDKLSHEYLIYIKIKNKIRQVLLNYPISWIIASAPYVLISSGRMFVKTDDNSQLSVHEEFRSRPISHIYYFLKIFIHTLINAPNIIRERSKRNDVKRLLK